MGDKLCIICGKSVAGLKAVRIKEDAVLGFIRNAKRALHIAQENELYVCEADLKAHQQKRSEFQKSMILFSILASIVVIAVVVGTIMSGVINFVALFASFLIAAMLILFSLIVKYIPATESNEPVFIQPKTMTESTKTTMEGIAKEAPESMQELQLPKPTGKKPTGRKIKRA